MNPVLVISPGVLPLPPVLGGAVENLIARLHPALVLKQAFPPRSKGTQKIPSIYIA